MKREVFIRIKSNKMKKNSINKNLEELILRLIQRG